jgi:MoxR-like ATPase
MYLYFSFDPAKPINDSAFTPVALMPSNRGRVSPNHIKRDWAGTMVNIATLDEAVLADVTEPADIKKGVADDTIKNLHNELELKEMPSVHFVWRQLCFVFNKMLQTTITPTYLNALPKSMSVQLEAVVTAIASEADTLSHAANKNEIEEFIEILSKNKKLLNAVLGGLPGGGWHMQDAVTPRVSKTAGEENAETLTEEATDEMSASTISFGFGKLSGETPDLKLAETEREDAASGVFLPKPDETYIINEHVAQLFKILQISRKNCPQNINLVGPHGCGKTELAIQFAARLNLPLLIMDCANLREARDWFGYKTAREGTVYWHESQFVKAVEAGNHVILLDELNRANPHLLNTLMPLLDARRFTYLEEKGDKICVGPGTVFFASMNEGAGYTGTSALDRAIRDRFPRVVELTYLGEKDEIKLLVKRVGIEEDIATRLVQMANKIRQDATGLSAALTESLSTRQLIAAAHDFAIGGVETLTFTVSNHFSADGDDDSERVRVQNIIQGKFGDLLAAKAAQAAQKGA